LNPPRTLGALLALCRDRGADGACIVSDARPPLSGKQLYERACVTAHWLRGRGIEERARVAVMLADRHDMAVACLCVAASTGCVPLNPAHTASELGALLSQLDVQLIITDAPADAPLRAFATARGVSAVAPEFLRLDARAETATTLVNDASAHAFYLATSGSSGAPKIVPLSHRNVCVSAQNLVTSLALTARDLAVHALPMFHVGGLVDLLLAPLLSGGSVHITRGPSAEELFDVLGRVQPTWYQGVPTMLASLCERAQTHDDALRSHRLRLLRSVSSALPAQVYERCRTTFGVPVIEIYGMTETAGVITSNPLQRQKPGSVGVPVGCEVRVLDGEIEVRGDSVFTEGWLQTGDRGYFDADGYLFLTGRSKEMINRGGEKIAPLEIDHALLMHPAVADAASFALPHPTLGEEVGAAVVLRPGQTVTDDALRTFLAQHLAAYKLPRVLHFMEALPRTASHKLRRHVLQQELSRSASAGRTPFVPTTREGVVLAKLWRTILKVEDVHADDSFFDEGADSLMAMTLLSELEAQCGVILSPMALAEHPTIGALESALLTAERAPTPTQPPRMASTSDDMLKGTLGRLRKAIGAWQGVRAHPDALIVGRNVSGTALPLHFCFDGAPAFDQLVSALGPDQPVYAMRSLWRVDDREGASERLARRYCEELLALQPRGPYVIGGFCDGAGIAQSIASELVERRLQLHTCILVDPAKLQPGAYPAGLILTSFGRMSLYQYYKRPELGLRRLFQGGVNVYRQHCEHQDCFEDPDVRLTAQYMREEITRSDQGLRDHAADRGVPLLPAHAHRYTLGARIPKRVRVGGQPIVQVTVTNTSPVTWHPNQVSVCSRWPTLKTAAIRWLKKNFHSTDRVDGSALIDRAVHPGESVTLALKIRAPNVAQLATLELDLVEEGICWFQEKSGSPPLRETVVVF
jgi:oxalate---CoA ligase